MEELTLNDLRKIDPNEMLQIFYAICINHRKKFGLKTPPKENDCDTQRCMSGCVLKGKMF